MTTQDGQDGLPEVLSYPRIMLMVTDCVVPFENADANTMLHWSVGGLHPFIEGARIVAMYFNDTGVDVYSTRVNERGEREGMRDHIPMTRVRVCREAMPFHVFAKELAAAELDDGEDDDDGGGEEEVDDETPSPAHVAAPSASAHTVPVVPARPVASTSPPDGTS